MSISMVTSGTLAGLTTATTLYTTPATGVAAYAVAFGTTNETGTPAVTITATYGALDALGTVQVYAETWTMPESGDRKQITPPIPVPSETVFKASASAAADFSYVVYRIT